MGHNPAPLNRMDAILQNPHLAPPAAQTLGMVLVATNEGTTRFDYAALREHGNPDKLSGALIAAVMDFAVVTSILTMLSPAQNVVTIDLHTTYLRSTPADGSILTVRGQAIHVGTSIAFADGFLENSDGELIAKATSSCRLLQTTT